MNSSVSKRPSPKASPKSPSKLSKKTFVVPNNLSPAETPLEPESDETSLSLEQKPKTPKKPIIISIIVSLVLLVGIGVFCYFKFIHSPNEIAENDVEFLTSVDAWEKVDAPTVVWSFHSDGTGELTTNKENYYAIKWYLSNSQLEIDTDWLYTLSDAFELTLDRVSDPRSFTVKNLADDTVSVFVPLGTYEAQSAEPTDANL